MFPQPRAVFSLGWTEGGGQNPRTRIFGRKISSSALTLSRALNVRPPREFRSTLMTFPPLLIADLRLIGRCSDLFAYSLFSDGLIGLPCEVPANLRPIVYTDAISA